MNTTTKKQKTLLALSFMLPVIIAFIGLILGRFAPFGGKDIYTAGGYSHIMAFYYELNDKLYTGASVLTGSLGNAYNDFGTTIAYYISDPLNLIAVLFPKRTMPIVLNIIYILKIGCAGLFFCMLLSYKKTSLLADKANMEEKRKDKIAAYKAKLEEKKLKKKNQKKDFKIGSDKESSNPVILFLRGFDFPTLAFSMAYALSSFMLSKGMNTGYLTVAALFPLLIMGIHKIVRENKWLLYTIAFTLSIFGNFHLALVAFIISLIYFLIQDYKEPQHFMKSLLYKLMSDALSIAMAAIVIIPAIKNAEFKESFSIKFPIFTNISFIYDVLKTQIIGMNPSNISYYSLGQDIYAGIFVFILICLYLFNRNIPLLRRAKSIIPLIIMFFGHIFSSLNYFLNGCYFSNSNLNLFDFAMIALTLLVCYEEFINIEHTRIIDVHISGIISLILIIITLLKSYHIEDLKQFYYACTFLLILYLLVNIYLSNSMTKGVFKTILALLIMLEIIPTFLIALRKIGNNTTDSRFTTDYAFFMAKKHIIEKDPNATILIYDRKKPNYEPVITSLEEYDYVISDKASFSLDYLPLNEEFYNIYIYKNTLKYDSPVYTPYNINSWKLSDSNYFDSLNLLLKSYLCGKDVYTTADGSFTSTPDTYIRPEGVKDLFTNYYIFKFIPDGTGNLFGRFNDEIVSHGNMTGTEFAIRYYFSSKYIYKNTSMNIGYAFFDADEMKANINNSLLCNKTENGNLTITVPYNGYVLVPIDSYSDLKITNNNENVYGTKITNNLISIPVFAGENDIMIKIDRSYFISVFLISLIGVLLMLLLFVRNISCNINTFVVNNKTIKFIIDNRMYIYCFIISFFIATTTLILVSVSPFGSNAIGNADTYQQSYGDYLLNYNNVKNNHYSIFVTNCGLISDYYDVFINSIINPFSRIIDRIIPTFLYDSLFSLRLILSFSISGLSLIFYLTHRKYGHKYNKTDRLVLVYGLVYTLCNYSIVYFGYKNFGFLKYIPIVILGLELLIKDKKPYLYITALFLAIENPYYGFMTCMFLFFYFLSFEFKDIKNFFITSLRFGLSSIAAAGLRCYIILPYFFKTRESLYLTGDSAVKQSTVGTNFLNTIQEFQMFTNQETITRVFYEINIYCGILFLIILPVYILIKQIPLQVRIKRLCILVIYYFAFNNETLNYIFHGFHNQSMVPNRFSVFIIYMMIIMGIDIIDNFKDLNAKNVLRITSITSIMVLVVWTIANKNNAPTKAYLVSVLFLVLYLLTLFCLYYKKQNIKKTTKLLTTILIIELLINCYGTFYKHVATKSINLDDVYTIKEIENSYADMIDPSINTEYIGTKLKNIGCFSGINTISTFTSGLTMAHAELVNKWNLLYSSNVIFYPLGNLLSDMMLHLKYHITDTYNLYSGSYYDQIDQVGNLAIHEANTYLPLGVFFNNTEPLMKWDNSTLYDYNDSLEYQNAFSNAIGYGNIYDSIIVKEYDSTIKYSSSDNYYMVTKSNQVNEENAIYGTTNYIINLHLSSSVHGDIYIGYGNMIFYAGNKDYGQEEDFEITIPSSDEILKMTFGVANKDNLLKLHNYLSNYTLQNITNNWNSFKGDIIVPNDGILYISLPNMQSFETYVDGKRVDHTTFLGGIGIPVTSGNHTISIVYTPRGMYGGFIVTIGTIALLIFTSFIVKRNKKKEFKKDSKTVA